MRPQNVYIEHGTATGLFAFADWVSAPVIGTDTVVTGAFAVVTADFSMEKMLFAVVTASFSKVKVPVAVAAAAVSVAT